MDLKSKMSHTKGLFRGHIRSRTIVSTEATRIRSTLKEKEQDGIDQAHHHLPFQLLLQPHRGNI
ncbi:hypothetical protein EST38_g2608 [Candolleomyces aberdarensis]|uniref:Uncharacterized protein n=1 Tax=Candolleomyces aberdarensis TaxID=2316362 RepID=A0A4Q2DWD7_9AGAR|nr:hypothetical protein EST38_g2608 [Candolleomyces aberdarensis]